MPIKKRGNDWYWGSQGPFKTREKAEKVAQAAYASGYSKAIQLNQWIKKAPFGESLDKLPLPPAEERVYVHEGKPAPKDVKVYDAGEFKGGHEGVQFWLTTDKNAHNAVTDNGHEIRDSRTEYAGLPDFKETVKLTDVEGDTENSKLKYPIESMLGQAQESDKEVPRYWTHQPPSDEAKGGRLGPAEDGGIQAYPLAEAGTRGGQGKELASSFKDGMDQKVIWLDTHPNPNISDGIIVDSSKLNLENVLKESAGAVHAGDIPKEAIVEKAWPKNSPIVSKMPFYAAHPGKHEMVNAPGSSSNFHWAAGASKEEAIKSYHDMMHPLKPDDTLESLVQEGKVNLPAPTDYKDGLRATDDYFKGNRLARIIAHHGEDTLPKQVLLHSQMAKDRYTGSLDEKAYGDIHEDISGFFPYTDRFSGRSEGHDVADGKTLITQKAIDRATKKIYDHAQKSLDHRGLPDEFWVYRGHADHDMKDHDEGMNSILSVSLSPHKAQIFASKAGQRPLEESAPKLSAYKVKKADILADVAAFEYSPFGEDEVLLDMSTLLKSRKQTATLPDTIWRPSTMKMLKFIQAELDMKKAWITNPRGDKKNDKQNRKYVEESNSRDDVSGIVQKQGVPFDTVNPDKDRRRQRLQKEGDGGGIGGEGAATVFTSENAGIFTPTHSERGRKEKRKKVTGVDRLNDFITERSPDRKMAKGVAFELVDWVRKELQKSVSYGTGGYTGDKRQQLTGGRTPDDHKAREDDVQRPVEFDAEPSKSAASDQKAEEARIKKLKDTNEEDNVEDTGQASEASPAGLNIQFGWDVGSSQADELHRGGDKDTLSEEDQDDIYERDRKKMVQRMEEENEQSRSEFLAKMLRDLD